MRLVAMRLYMIRDAFQHYNIIDGFQIPDEDSISIRLYSAEQVNIECLKVEQFVPSN